MRVGKTLALFAAAAGLTVAAGVARAGNPLSDRALDGITAGASGTSVTALGVASAASGPTSANGAYVITTAQTTSTPSVASGYAAGVGIGDTSSAGATVNPQGGAATQTVFIGVTAAGSSAVVGAGVTSVQ